MQRSSHANPVRNGSDSSRSRGFQLTSLCPARVRTPVHQAYHAPVARSSPSNAAPAILIPMAAVSVTELPEGSDWVYELKLDGSPYSSIVIDSRKRTCCAARKSILRLANRRVSAYSVEKLSGTCEVVRYRYWTSLSQGVDHAVRLSKMRVLGQSGEDST